ncbi:MAG TPA: sugar transferase [Candidatus Methylacidiphilales bacterium]|jgi:exopolysaccharide biosynthesis polyprenyl glycosylphosphotransferase|nr:sugar transferase [Candidatus Methylacidiphilales bacterium]
MLSRQHNFYRQFLQLADALVIGVSLWIAHALRFFVLNQVIWFDDFPIEPQFANCYRMIALALFLGPLALEYMGFYQTHPPVGWLKSLGQIAWALFLLLVAIFTCVVIFHVPQTSISRTALGLFFLLATGLLAIRSAIFRVWLAQRGSRTHLRQYILLCGLPRDREIWKQRFLSQPGKDFEIKAEFNLREEGLERFIETLHDETVDIVVFSLEETIIPQIREALLACEAEGVEAWISADFIQTLFTRVQFDRFAGQPLLIYRTTPTISWELVAKRVIDVAGSSFLLIVTSPLIALIAVLVRWTSPGPVIFWQNRSGLHGRPFRMYKFRSMVTNAEQARAELESMNEMSGPVFKVKNDPRVTPLGRWLRRTSLDELPQLWNVLRGEMSLVGPRPLPLYETANFVDISQRRRMSVRPGLTCLWQVRGRNQISDFKDWVRLDLEYIDRWNLWLDIRILIRTVPVVLFGWGAK